MSFIKIFTFIYLRASDYPSQCVEDIFGICGDIETFHLFMKNSMNISDKVENVDTKETNEEVCIKTQQDGINYLLSKYNGFGLHVPLNITLLNLV